MKTILGLVLLSLIGFSCTEIYEEHRHYDVRDRVTGRYEVDEYSDTYNEHVLYSMYISKDYSSGDGIFLDDFYAEGVRVYAYVNNDHITIPFQVTEGYQIEGHGTHYRGEVRLTYSVRDRYSNAPTDYCDMVAFLR